MSGCVNRRHRLAGHGPHKSRKSQLACLVSVLDGVPFATAYRAVSESWGLYFEYTPRGWRRVSDRALLRFNNEPRVRRHREARVR